MLIYVTPADMLHARFLADLHQSLTADMYLLRGPAVFSFIISITNVSQPIYLANLNVGMLLIT